MKLEETLTEIQNRFGISREEAYDMLCGFYLYLVRLSSAGWKIYIEKDNERYELKEV